MVAEVPDKVQRQMSTEQAQFVLSIYVMSKGYVYIITNPSIYGKYLWL